MKNFNWNFVLAIIAALVTMFVVVSILQMVSHEIFPPPEGMDKEDKEAIKRFIAEAPTKALIMIPLGWVLGSFAGALVGSNINPAKKRIIFFVVSIFTLMSALMMMILYPSPWYFWVISAFIFPAALLGSRLVPAKN